MKAITTYRDLNAWTEAIELVVEVYQLTKSLPTEELYGLKSQVRRSAVSIPSNIVEGHGRRSNNKFAHHLSIAKGSLCELETQLILCLKLEFITRNDLKPIWKRTQTVGKLLTGLIRSLK